MSVVKFPAKGYQYFEPELKWRAQNELAMIGLDAVAKALQIVRIQNPGAGLNPSYDACVEAIMAFTCKRLPKYCAQPEVPSVAGQAIRGKKQKKCKGCGRR